MPWVWISVGSNIDREQHIGQALRSLQEMFVALRVSPIYETESVGFSGDAFYNLVVGFATELAPARLHRALRDIEASNGRTREGEKFASRTLDLDVLTYGEQIGDEGGKLLPRDEILEYAFVLRPLADVAPLELHPAVQQSYQQLWSGMPEQRKRGLQRIDTDWRELL